jgi:hypothetical protein
MLSSFPFLARALDHPSKVVPHWTVPINSTILANLV